MSNYIRRRKSKAMQDPAGINNNYSFGGSGGSYIMRRRYIENSRHNNIRKTNLYSLSSTNTGASAYSCCSLGERKVAPVVHYSYKTYMDMKLKGCSNCPLSQYTIDVANARKTLEAAEKVIADIKLNGGTPNAQQLDILNDAQTDLENKKALEKKHLDAVASKKNVFKRMPDNSTEIYLENKKSKVYLETDDITACPNLTKKDTDCIQSGESCKTTLSIDARRAGQDQIKEIANRLKAIDTAKTKIKTAEKNLKDVEKIIADKKAAAIVAGNTYTPTADENNTVNNNKTLINQGNLELNNANKNKIVLGRFKQRSYRQYMNSKKAVITKPRMFNYASLQTFARKSKRVCGNKPFESQLANIQSCKHI